MRGPMSRIAGNVARFAAGHMARLIIFVSLGLILGACTKCDVPGWQHSESEMAPLACHSDAPAS
jgi:hypothetical protein